MALLMALLIQPGQATLQVNKISESNGFVQIKIREVEIVNTTNTLLHIINIEEVRNILREICINIENLNLHNEEIIRNEINLIESKLRTIVPGENRRKRGLINAGGKVFKWLFGTMDDEDRQEIFYHVSITEKNSHNY